MTSPPSLFVFVFPLMLLFCAWANSIHATDLGEIPADLKTPVMTNEKPMAGKRVKQVNKDYTGTEVYHALYLPVDWKPGKKYPVIVEYAGNKWGMTSLGTVEGSSLGYGISGGKGVIWICMPFVDSEHKRNAVTWWGDVAATVAYCKRALKRICEEFGGDPELLFIAGFSRGAIACNYIGLHDDEISTLWRGFICHSHYDGVKKWGYPGSDRVSAARRLKRLGKRPQWISHESSVAQTRKYLEQAYPAGNFQFQSMSFRAHVDTWVLRDIPERKEVREWFWGVVNAEPGRRKEAP